MEMIENFKSGVVGNNLSEHDEDVMYLGFLTEMEEMKEIYDDLMDIEGVSEEEQKKYVIDIFIMLNYTQIKESGVELSNRDMYRVLMNDMDTDTYWLMRNVLINFYKGNYEVMCGVNPSPMEVIGKKGMNGVRRMVINILKGVQ